MSNVAAFPNRRHAVHMDAIAETIRSLTLWNDDLTFAEKIALLEVIKLEVMHDLQNKHGVDEE